MSWQLTLLNAQLRWLAKPKIARATDPEEAARSSERAAKFNRDPPFLRHLERPGGLVFVSSGPIALRQVILYFHGGAFVSGSPTTHRAMVGELSRMCGREACLPHYPLLPKGVFPEPFDAALAAWNRLLDMGYRPEDIVVGGDSAGGNLCFGLLSHLCQIGQIPAGAFGFSPWVDLALTGETLQSNAESDVLLPAERISELTEMYLGDEDAKDPRASPLFADFPNCPSVWIASSQSEVLRADSQRLADRLKGFGADVTEHVLPDAPHVWPFFQGKLPEGTETLKEAAGFVQDCFEAVKR